MNGAERFVLRLPNHLYDWNAGWILSDRFLQLTHIGRTSGQPYKTVLEVIGTEADTYELIVVSGLGASADWFNNLQHRSAVEVAVGSRRFRPQHRILSETEAYHVLGAYERRHRLAAPLVRHLLSRLVAWPYDSSDEARRRLVQELPMVAFRPVGLGK